MLYSYRLDGWNNDQPEETDPFVAAGAGGPLDYEVMEAARERCGYFSREAIVLAKSEQFTVRMYPRSVEFAAHAPYLVEIEWSPVGLEPHELAAQFWAGRDVRILVDSFPALLRLLGELGPLLKIAERYKTVDDIEDINEVVLDNATPPLGIGG